MAQVQYRRFVAVRHGNGRQFDLTHTTSTSMIAFAGLKNVNRVSY